MNALLNDEKNGYIKKKVKQKLSYCGNVTRLYEETLRYHSKIAVY